MIIEHPTALYRDVIPGVGDSGNVTWLISSTNPPRSSQPLQRIPDAEFIRRREPSPITPKRHREAAGDLVFSITSAMHDVPGTAMRQFEIGQIIDFEEENFKSVNPSSVPQVIELQHDLNLLDLSAAGLDSDEASQLLDESVDAKEKIEREIADLKVEIGDASIAINENQKNLNEARKIKGAAVVVGNEKIIVKMGVKITSLENERTSLIDVLNGLNQVARIKFDELLKVIPLVR